MIEEFNLIWKNRPDKRGSGSSKYSNCYYLYEMCKILNPKRIIESGTWKGQSSYIFKKICPDAEIICFDISFDNLIWNDDSIKYYEKDWMKVDIEGDRDSVIYFDDHISQKKRLLQAHKRGFKHIIFDDNIPEKDLHLFKDPPTLTIENCFEKKDKKVLPLIDIYEVKNNLNLKLRNTYLTYIKLK